MRDDSVPLPPPTGHAQTHDEIAAEIADHLAAAEADLTKRGIAAGEAREAARKKFGDVEKIQKTCYWIQNGETIMLRWTLIALASVLCILLGLSVLGNWRTQSQLAEQVGKLSEELKAIAAAKQSPPPVPQPPEITGVIYAGSKDKPLANAAITIIKTDGTVIRRTNCDGQGRYHSGPLEAGDYCITTETENSPPSVSPEAHWVAQTQPLFVHAASGTVSLDIDAKFRQGKFKISSSRPLPEIHRPKKYYLTSRLHVFVKTPRKRDQLWTTAAIDSPKAWPVYSATSRNATYGGGPKSVASATALFKLKEGEEVPYVGKGDSDATVFPAGNVPIAATLLVNIFPMDQEEKGLAEDPSRSPRFLADMIDSKLAKDSGWAWWNFPLGKQWLEKLDGMPINEDHLKRFRTEDSQFVNLDLKEDVFTRIRAEIPEGIEQEIERAIETTTDMDEFKKLIDQGLLTRRIKLTVIGFEPHVEAKTKP